METVCVFCGSRDGSRPSYKAAAERMGATLARRGLGLVYGGGQVGMMGALADAALKEGGKVVGVIPKALVRREDAHTGISELHVVGSMHERKKLMADLSDGFVALPGGYGTLEEFLEVLSWAQLGIHQKPCGLLDVDGFFESLSSLFDKAVVEGFVSPDHRSLVLMEKDPQLLLDTMHRYAPPKTKKWVGRQDL
jgi:uncharacterized protein (TIGR00730 family)